MAFAFAGVLAFSFRPILIKLAYAVPTANGHAGPVTLIFLRMMLSLPFFAATAWWLRGRSPALTARDWCAVAALGFVGYYLASFLDFIGLQYVSAGVGRLILFLYPTLVLILSFVFLRKPPARRELAALVLSYGGIALVLSNGLAQADAQKGALLGALLIFASALCYAVYLVAGSEMVKRIGSMRFTAYTMVAATAPAVAQFLVLEGPGALDLPAQVWLYAIIMASFSTVLPVFLQSEALRRIGPNRFALIGAIGPVTTAAAGAVGLEEPFTLLQAAGAALVIAGVLLVSLRKPS
ncbi:MAG TPA: DMT family transporter [Burkholderiales bacterium]|jgi:drug/metabolite transporter (DMT)-like permease|nr:DMT family transporter [Burkholderiales bacterium]